jgi:hypothetical protein
MSYLIHPDDIEAPRFGNWADDFNTYEDACRYYGCDTPAQLAAEAEADFAEECVADQDDMEARGGPLVGHWRSNYAIPDLEMICPF